MVKNGALPRIPNKDDGATAVAHTVLGSVLGAGISAFAQNIATKGTMAAMAGSRLGLTELNWSSIGSAVVVGAAVGASIGIATYLAREGNRARRLAEEKNSLSSQTNVSLGKMMTHGPDAWAINRILEKDPKAMGRIEAACSEYTMELTHTGPSAARGHTAIALCAAITSRSGAFVADVHAAKSDWTSKTTTALADLPSTQLLFNTLLVMPPVKSTSYVLDMHSSWATIVSQQMPTPDESSFKAAFKQWSAKNFQPGAPESIGAVCFGNIVEMAKDPAVAMRIKQEAAQTDAMVAGMLLDTHIAVKEVEPLSVSPIPAWNPSSPSLG